MLELEGLEAGYDQTMVLQGLDLRLDSGDCVGILGRNGVGKTTLLKAILGLRPAVAGRIVFAGEDVTDVPTHLRARAGMSYVPQGRLVFPGLSVEDNLRAAAFSNEDRKPASIVAEIFEVFPILRDRRGVGAGSLSGGQQQMLALGRALATDPQLLLLDEPSEGIQPSIIDEIVDAIRALNEERGITILLVEQNLEFAVRLIDTAHILDKGLLVREVPASQVLDDPDLLKEYLGV